MRGTLALAVSLAALAATAGAQTGATAAPGARQADEAITRALRANDMEAALRAYAEDAVFFPPGEMAQVGKAAIRRGYAEFLGAFHVNDFAVSDVHYAGSGDVSVAWGRFSLSAAPKAGGAPLRWEGRYTLVARRVGGRWLVVSDHASVPAGPPAPPMDPRSGAPATPRPVSAPRH